MARTAFSPILQFIRRIHRDPRMEGSADQELLRRFVDGRDEAAFETILRRHGAMVLDVCRGVLGNEADVEDAFQATFLILARRAESIRKGASLACWLHGVAYRTALRARADGARRQRHEARTPQPCTTTDADELTWREIRRVVHEELDRLPERHRAALVLCYLQGKTQDEAAVELGLPKGTLKGRLERGRALLQAKLVRRGLGPGVVLTLAAWPAATKVAGLSPPLVSATVKTATSFAAGKAAISGVSPSVAALSEGMVKAMFIRKLQIAAILLLALAGSGTGLALFIQGSSRTEAGAALDQSVSAAKPEPGADVATKSRADSTLPIRSLRGHVNRLVSVAYSPDGTSIATASWDGTVRIWNATAGEEVRRLGLDKGARLQTGESSDNTFDREAGIDASAPAATCAATTAELVRRHRLEPSHRGKTAYLPGRRRQLRDLARWQVNRLRRALRYPPLRACDREANPRTARRRKTSSDRVADVFAGRPDAYLHGTPSHTPARRYFTARHIPGCDAPLGRGDRKGAPLGSQRGGGEDARPAAQRLLKGRTDYHQRARSAAPGRLRLQHLPARSRDRRRARQVNRPQV